VLVPALVVGVVALGASALSLVSGFGLGTLLLPAFALFFPVPVAIAATAVVHVAHNLFKLALLLRAARPWVLLAFGVPAALAAFPGAALLTRLSRAEPLVHWRAAGLEGEVTPVALVTGLLILLFGLMEGGGPLARVHASPRWLPVGGALSGFLGGLSGHQGALRAAFLQPLGLPPQAWAGTQAALAVMVDAARLAVYGAAFLAGPLGALAGGEVRPLVAIAMACAFAGALLGRRLLPKVTIEGVRRLTSALLVGIGLGLASGVL
jgi:uncharacterized membrane protein YfcA